MSKSAGEEAALLRHALRLLINCLDAAKPRLSAAAIQANLLAAQALRQHGLLQDAGHDRAVVSASDHRDLPIEAEWCAQQNGFGYFRETRGWTAIAAQELTAWEVDFGALFSALTGGLTMTGDDAPTELVPNCLWDLGSASLGKQSEPRSIFFARRLFDQATYRRIVQALPRDRPLHTRVLLTTKRRDNRVLAIRGCSVISLASVLSKNSLRVDPSALASELVDQASSVNSVLEVFAKGGEVHFKGQVFRPKGSRQRAVIWSLFQSYLSGELKVSSAEILVEVECRSQRMRDLFKDSGVWGRLITEQSGMCTFCWDEHPAGNKSRE